MAEDISSKVKKIVADHLGIDEAKVTDEASTLNMKTITQTIKAIAIGTKSIIAGEDTPTRVKI